MNEPASKIIFDNQYYVVCITSAGLSVQHKKANRGRVIAKNADLFKEWKTAFEERIDDAEAQALCRGFLSY